MITEEQKKRIVQEILKTSIIASSTYYGKPCLVSDSKNNNYIISGQKYKGCSDEDISFSWCLLYTRMIAEQACYRLMEKVCNPHGIKQGRNMLF